MEHIDDAQRRARLARRHALAAPYRVESPEDATRAVVCLHATEPASVYLSVAARSEGVGVEDVERALYIDRSLVKQLAMRRTLFVVPRDLLPSVWGSASARVAGQERRTIGRDVVRTGIAADGDAWLEEMADQVLGVLVGDQLGATQIRRAVEGLDVTISMAPGTKWGGEIPVAPRVLTWMGARADLVRGIPDGHWRTSRPRWTSMAEWLGERPRRCDAETGYAELVRRWLTAFGPGSEADIVWWLGATKGIVRAALAEVGAVEVSLDGGGTGWVLSGDLDPVPEPDPWAALLPVLDPTTMGWKERDFYLDPEDRPSLFDSNGNGGTTAWWNGRVVGCWVQDEDAAVRVVPRGDPGSEALDALDREAERLSEWLDGVQISSVYTSQQMKGALLP